MVVCLWVGVVVVWVGGCGGSEWVYEVVVRVGVLDGGV